MSKPDGSPASAQFPPPSLLGKLTTTMHVVTVTIVLLANLALLPAWLPTAAML